MKNVLFSFFCITAFFHLQAQLEVTEIGALPEAVSNNAVCEGYVNGIPYLFSFSGIDTSKIYSGIHLKSFRYNITTGQSEQIANLPDNNGKIAAGASRIGNIIYIAGGYHVAANGSETSSTKMHRYDINNNLFLTDGADIPVATDDHVQAVWRDSLIYLITGWSNTGNIPDVQIYNPTTDTWLVGTPTPNNHQYKSFGASGTILVDTIFYFGGAASSAGFGIQNQVRKGTINPLDPTDIIWSIDTPDIAIVGYRMACTSVNNELHWIGGSENTYNYDGIAYDGSGGVAPSDRDLYFTTENAMWQDTTVTKLPMDLRGIAQIHDTVQYIAGGMLDGQVVTDKIYRLEWNKKTISSIDDEQFQGVSIQPNPFVDFIYIENDGALEVEVFDMNGKLILADTNIQNTTISTSKWISGIYFVSVNIGSTKKTFKMIKE